MTSTDTTPDVVWGPTRWEATVDGLELVVRLSAGGWRFKWSCGSDLQGYESGDTPDASDDSLALALAYAAMSARLFERLEV